MEYLEDDEVRRVRSASTSRCTRCSTSTSRSHWARWTCRTTTSSTKRQEAEAMKLATPVIDAVAGRGEKLREDDRPRLWPVRGLSPGRCQGNRHRGGELGGRHDQGRSSTSTAARASRSVCSNRACSAPSRPRRAYARALEPSRRLRSWTGWIRSAPWPARADAGSARCALRPAQAPRDHRQDLRVRAAATWRSHCQYVIDELVQSAASGKFREVCREVHHGAGIAF